jgi:hypothetical protein
MIVQFKYRSMFKSERRVVGRLLSIWSTGAGPFKVTKFRVQTSKATEEFKLHYVAQKDMNYMKDCLDAEVGYQAAITRTLEQAEANRQRRLANGYKQGQ